MSVMPKARVWHRLRWLLLEAVYVNHREQGHRYDDQDVLRILHDHGHTQFGVKQAHTLLQDEKERNHLRYREQRRPRQGEFPLILDEIEITAEGQRFFEARQDDPRLHYVE